MKFLWLLLIVLIIIIGWLFLGLIGFFIDARYSGYKELDQEAKEELAYGMLLGPLTIVCVLLNDYFIGYFYNIIDKILHKISKKR